MGVFENGFGGATKLNPRILNESEPIERSEGGSAKFSAIITGLLTDTLGDVF